jgi:hypothetical protein
MSRASRETEIYRRDAKTNHSFLTPTEREKLVAVSSAQIPIRSRTDRNCSHTSHHPLHDHQPEINMREFQASLRRTPKFVPDLESGSSSEPNCTLFSLPYCMRFSQYIYGYDKHIML